MPSFIFIARQRFVVFFDNKKFLLNIFLFKNSNLFKFDTITIFSPSESSSSLLSSLSSSSSYFLHCHCCLYFSLHLNYLDSFCVYLSYLLLNFLNACLFGQSILPSVLWFLIPILLLFCLIVELFFLYRILTNH
jgi:hypothetical protein